MKIQRQIVGGLFSVMLAVILTSACSPVPRRALTESEKLADLYWTYSIFDQNYAPKDWKEKLKGFQYDALKASYVEKVKATKSNEEFYATLHQFVAEFQDAHTGGSFTPSALKDRQKIAYIGVLGKRAHYDLSENGGSFEITGLLPTFETGASTPFSVGDKILEIDGVPVADAVTRELKPYRDLGQTDSTTTLLMPKLFSRMQLQYLLPQKATANLKLQRASDKAIVNIEVPWVVQDFMDYLDDQRKASVPPTQPKQENNVYELAQLILSNKIDLLSSYVARFSSESEVGKIARLWDSFEYLDMVPDLNSNMVKKLQIDYAVKKLAAEKEELTIQNSPYLDAFKKNRIIPEGALFLDGSATYPTYVKSEVTYDQNGIPTGNYKFVATMYLSTFSPVTMSPIVVEEVRKTLSTLQKNGVEYLVIDTLDNGGGSLLLGMQLAQLLSKDKLTLPDIQFALSDSWMDTFERESVSGSTPLHKEIAKRTLKAMQEDKSAGLRISRRMSLDSLMAYEVKPNTTLGKPFKVAVLVNEGCASMCDIFASIIQDNKLGVLVGSRTMGAGGNVVNYFAAPNSGFTVNQTESLIVRPDGSYIENVGITPEVKESTIDNLTAEKYTRVRNAALKALLR